MYKARTMNEKLTPEQKSELVKAVLSATGYKDCAYFDTTTKTPVCVVGCLVHARGAKAEDFANHQGMTVDTFEYDATIVDLPIQLLVELQNVWDGRPYDGVPGADPMSFPDLNENESRMACLFLIEEASS